MKKVIVNDKYYLKVNPFGYDLIEVYEVQDEDGIINQREKKLGYYGQLAHALRAVNYEIVRNNGEESTLKEYIQDINSGFDDLKKDDYRR
ncbi:hypothetical protein ACF3NG_06855 [Aerococcaceae bacterium WGS1372]